MAAVDAPQTVPAKTGAKYKLKKGTALGKNDYFDENTGTIYHGGKEGVKLTLNDDGTHTVNNASGYERTLADGTILEAGMKDANMARRRRDAMVEKIVPVKTKETAKLKPEAKVDPKPQKKETKSEEKKEVAPETKEKKQPVSPIQAGKQKKHWSQVTWAHDVIKDYKQASPERKKKLLEDLKARYQQFNIANIKDGKMAQDARYHIDSANEAFGNASGWFGGYQELSDTDFAHAAMATNRLTNMLPTPAPAETSATAGTKPASTGTASQGNAGGKTTIEVQVKFNNQMFEEQVKRITMANARRLVEQGAGTNGK